MNKMLISCLEKYYENNEVCFEKSLFKVRFIGPYPQPQPGRIKLDIARAKINIYKES